MTKYVIGYTYHQHRDYRRLYALLAQWGAKRILDSTWFADLNGSAPAVRDALRSVGDADDAFVVLELVPGTDWAHTAGVYRDGAAWLESNI